MQTSPRHRSSRPNWAALVLCAALAVGTVVPAHAFLGLLGKAAGKAATAGKAAGTAGKGAAVGAGAVAAESATGVAGVAGKGAAALGDDAAHAAQLGPRGAGAGHEFSSVNAALPPEVAAYLSKPAKDLTPKDTSRMMDSYRQMVERAGKSGDFTAVERLPTSAGTARTLPTAETARPATSPSKTETTTASSGVPSALPIHALRVLAHASHAGNHDAQAELDRVCRDGSVASKRFSKEMRATPEFKETCANRKLATTRTAAAR
ncbi:type IV secretory pathway TrbL component [Variovorax boronicumulans]|uniref:hypothetical protein n=1 Tax=Variovorax TaxID=34072 RepID=UPI00277DA8F2|nr:MULTISPECIES: hypothetical protein [Variovorax]MDQ0033523.1 type IV secretory pathway TrbL component [Variovorax boronicumulans]MDQ0606474.1 type IV secretory pathway TrbL component [Variovorax sp. W1I1]